MQSIHFFRAGTHISSDGRSLTFTQADLAKIAASYDPATHEAPIVVGHPKTDAPAYGWVERVEARPDGLHAIPRQVNAEFAELVKAGYIRHIGLSNVSVDELRRARRIAPIVSVQNRYNISDRASEDVLRECERLGIAFLPWYPLAAGSYAP